MSSTEKYKIIETLYESSNSSVYRCETADFRKRVVIKKLKMVDSTPLQISRFNREFAIAKSVKNDGIVKVLSLEPYNGSLAIFMEDIGAEALSNIMLNVKLSIEEKISIANKIARYIGNIHERNIIHMDINPSNIIWNPKTDILQIIDFGISTELQYEKREIINPNVLEGTLPYISPEQTGRMNRYIDYRTDLYSLGVTLYELFTDRLPFYTKDPLKLIHAHIARNPDNPQAIINELPTAIAEIILKLMAKDPEDRYKDSAGVVSDLEYCLLKFKKGAEIESFEIAKNDLSGRFIVPQRIYGRSKELNNLISAFDRVRSEGVLEVFLFGGCSGIGKTSLVSEITKYTSRKKAIYVKGKFEKSDKTPYSGLKRALSDLIRQKLAEPKEKLASWKMDLLENIGQNGQVLIDLLPEIEFVIGPQPTPPELPPKETENRYNHVYQKFIKTCCTKKQPLVIFIDDLQWADLSTLNFLEKLLIGTPEQYLLFIGAFRDNEVNAHDPLSLFITKLDNDEIRIKKTYLGPLKTADISNIIQDTVNLHSQKTIEISKIFLTATKGIPFQLNQLLYSLYNDGLFWFDVAKQAWDCDIHQILKNTITDNTVEIVMSKFKGMNDPERRLINVAACIGNHFELAKLAAVEHTTPIKMADELESLVRRNIICPSENYKYLKFYKNVSVIYYFVHDRIWQAAYNMYDQNERKKTHLKIGTVLLEGETEGTPLIVFDIVNQLNHASDLFKNKMKLAGLNYKAGKKAKETAAWKSSLDYFVVSISLLPDDSWAVDYSFSLLLYIDAAESAYLVGEFDYAQELIEISLANVENKLDQCKAYKIKIDSLIAQGMHLESVKLGLYVLSKLDIKFPKKPNKLNKLRVVLSTYFLLKCKKIKNLHFIKNMNDERIQEACRIMMTITSSAYISGSKYFLFLFTNLIVLFIKKGFHPQASYGCAAFANVVCGVLHDYEFAYNLGKTAVDLSDRTEAKLNKSKVVYVTNAGVNTWKLHYKELVPTVHKHYKVAKDIGDFEFSSFNLYCYCYLQFIMGIDLPIIDQMMSKYTKEVSSQDTVFNYFRVYHQTTQNLIGKSDVPWKLNGNILNEDELIKYFIETGNRIGLFEVYSSKLHLCYLFNQYDLAIELVPTLDGFLKEALAKHNIPIVNFYQALTICAVYHKLTVKEQKKQYKALKKKIKNMRMWSKYGPNNFKHKYYLLRAEINRIQGKHETVVENYDLAIAQAGYNGFVNEKALCHELAAKYYLSCGKQELFKIHIKKAHNDFSKWGSTAKCRDLEKKHTEIFKTNQIAESSIENSFPTITTYTEIRDVAYIDLLSAIKCSQLISCEIEINKLLNSLIKISTECAGAERGCLITRKGDEYLVQANFGMDIETDIEKLLNDKEIAKSVINFVENTKKPLLLDDAFTNNAFCDDVYIKSNHIKSLLCMPYIHKEKIIGLLYLENNQSANVFNKERIKILQIIASQAVVSIENAKLYGMVASSEKRYKSIFDNSQDGIFQISPAGQVITANHSLVKLLGFDNADQIVGNADYLVESFCVDKGKAQDIRVIIDKEGLLKDHEVDIKNKNNQIIKGMLNVKAIKDDDGHTLYYEGNLKDITKQKQIQALKIDKRSAEAKALAKSQFLANMSHDIRTPINTILGYSELLKDNLPDDSILNEYIGNISSSGRFLLSLINQILEFTKIDTGKMDLNTQPVSIFEMLDEIKTQFEEKINEKGLAFNIKTDLYFKDLTINIDELRLKQILINLIDNAYKYTDSGHINLIVQKNSVNGNKLDMSIIVEDSGVGISDKEKIFEEFEQLQPVSDKIIEGSGLGLSIVKKIVVLMNGSIKITNSQAGGSKFEILLTGIDIVEETKRNEYVSQWDKIDLKFDDLSIVVADDNVKNRNLIIDYLKPYGLNVLEAKNGKEVISVVKQNEVSLVLMDLKMPVMDGIQATLIIKSDGEIKSIPVIALTADISEETKNRAMTIGCDGFLLKPISRKALINELMRFLAHSGFDLSNQPKKLSELNIPIDYDPERRSDIITDLQRLKDQKLGIISKTMIISDIGKFGEDIEKIGIKYHSNYFKEWGRVLKRNAINFSNKKIQKMLSQYPELISKISNN